MKKLKEIGALIILNLFNLCSTCFADIVIPEEYFEDNGLSYRDMDEPKLLNFILTGILVLVIIICTVIIIKRIIKNKKEKNNNDK